MTERIYTGKDRDTLLREGMSRLQRSFPEYTFEFANDQQRLLLETLAYAARGMNFFTDVQVNELWLKTAQLRSTIAKRAAERGYSPKGAASASGDLRVRPSEPLGRTIRLPQGFRWEAENGYVYETTHEVVWQPGDATFKAVTISQGETRSATFRSDGSRSQRHPITSLEDGERVAWRSIDVVVDGEPWEERDDMIDTDDAVYKAAYTADPPYIEFGDGAVGQVPTDGAEIDVEFRATRGLDGETKTSNITGAVDDLVVAGESVDLEYEPGTERISGASDIESKSSIKARAPHADHSDGSIVTDPDFEALVEGYQHPLYGAVAAARPVLATSISNDLVALNLINSIRAKFVDADDLLDEAMTDISSLFDDMASARASLDEAAQAALDELVDDGPLDGALSTIDGTHRDAALNRTYTVQTKSDELGKAATDADDAASTLETDVENISTGGSDQLTESTKNDLLASISDIRQRTKSNGVFQSIAGTLSTVVSNLQSDLDGIRSEVASAQDARGTARDEVNTVQSESSNVASSESDVESRVDQLDDDLEDPWEGAIIGAGGTKSDLDKLEDHLDEVFADACGPNLISVPILSYDADGFYVAPSVGLMRSVEEYIRDRDEPSAIFSVADGSQWLVEPQVDVSIQPESGQPVSTLKSQIETELLDVIRDRGFGRDLPLDDLYDAIRDVEGTVLVNVEITGFDGGATTHAEIDADGNLLIPEREVMTRPSMTFYRRFADGSKEVL